MPRCRRRFASLGSRASSTLSTQRTFATTASMSTSCPPLPWMRARWASFRRRPATGSACGTTRLTILPSCRPSLCALDSTPQPSRVCAPCWLAMWARTTFGTSRRGAKPTTPLPSDSSTASPRPSRLCIADSRLCRLSSKARHSCCIRYDAWWGLLCSRCEPISTTRRSTRCSPARSPRPESVCRRFQATGFSSIAPASTRTTAKAGATSRPST
eukprot:Amastigsp_a512579_10.p3 type:complete len:214 gc:universal Amastigsp_a512579_10:860-219(-)